MEPLQAKTAWEEKIQSKANKAFRRKLEEMVATRFARVRRRRWEDGAGRSREFGVFIGDWGMGISVRVAGGEWLVAGKGF